MRARKRGRDRKVYYKTTTNGKKTIMIVKTPGSQMGSPAASKREREQESKRERGGVRASNRERERARARETWRERRRIMQIF